MVLVVPGGASGSGRQDTVVAVSAIEKSSASNAPSSGVPALLLLLIIRRRGSIAPHASLSLGPSREMATFPEIGMRAGNCAEAGVDTAPAWSES